MSQSVGNVKDGIVVREMSKDQLAALVRADAKPVVCRIDQNYINLGDGLLGRMDGGLYTVEESGYEFIVQWRQAKH